MLGEIEGVSAEELRIYRAALKRTNVKENGITRKNDARLSNMLHNDHPFSQWDKLFKEKKIKE